MLKSMGLFDETFGGIVLGFAAWTLAQGRATGVALRPLFKELIKVSMRVTDQARSLAAEAMEQASDLVAEVRAETDAARTSGGATPSARGSRKKSD
jgi:hypothetical protein